MRSLDGQGESYHDGSVDHVNVGRPLGPSDFVTLEPDDVFGTMWSEQIVGPHIEIVEPGRCKLRGGCGSSEAGDEWGLDAWTGSLRSNWVTVVFDDE